MPRYEYRAGNSAKFWEIELEGNSYRVCYGRLGTGGASSSKTFEDASRARARYEKMIASKIKKGYQLVTSQKVAPLVGQESLEAAIFADPDSREAWLAYAQWLKGTNDIRGRMIEEAQAGESADAGLQADHEAEWAGPELAAILNEIVDECLHLEWEYGFVKKLRVASYWEDPEIDAIKILRTTLQSPASRFIQEIRVGLTDRGSGEQNYAEAWEMLTGCGSLPALRLVHMGDYEYPDDIEISWTEMDDVSGLYPIAPNLETLILTGGSIELRNLSHSRLKNLTLETGGLPAAAVKSVAAANLPELRRLEMWLGSDEYGGGGKINMLAPLLDGKVLPKLERLGLKNAYFQNDIAKGIATSAILKRIRCLDMSMGTMTDSGAQAILDHVANFKHLERLDLSENSISDQLSAQLQKALGAIVDISDQDGGDEDEDDVYFYTSVGE